jgi:uncharacterized protein (TIGR00369 family)
MTGEAMTAVDPPVLYLPGGPEALLRVGDVSGTSALAVGSMRTGPWMLAPDGRPAAGSIGVLTDVVLGGALVAARQPGMWGATTEMSIDFGAALPVSGDEIVLRAATVHRDEHGGLARGLLRDSAGAVVASASQRLRFIPGTPDEAPPAHAVEPDASSGIFELFGVRSAQRDDRAHELIVDLGPHVQNPLGNLHGGVLLCLSEVAGLIAVQSSAHPLSTASVHVAYLRPGPRTGELRLLTETLHRGRTLALARVYSVRPDGKTCSVATVAFQPTN